jgi:hypothetical protein
MYVQIELHCILNIKVTQNGPITEAERTTGSDAVGLNRTITSSFSGLFRNFRDIGSPPEDVEKEFAPHPTIRQIL